MGVILNLNILKNHSYLPENFIDRDAEIQKLTSTLNSDMAKVYVSGGAGLGKTACVRYVLSKIPNRHIYISCKQFNSYARIISKIAEELEIPSLGKDVGFLSSRIGERIDLSESNMIFIFDEIHELVISEKSDVSIYNFLEMNTLLKNNKSSISVILISNKQIDFAKDTRERITTM